MLGNVSFVSYCSISAAIFAVTISAAYYTSYSYIAEETTITGILSSLTIQILQSRIYVLACMNTALCLLILFGKFIQFIFFGSLRVSETKNIYDRSLSYTLFKIIFVGAILEPLDIPQFLICTVWFSILGFLKIYSLLCRDRFEYLLTTADIPIISHIRLISLLSIIQGCNLAWFSLCLFFFAETGYSTIFLLTFECFTLFLKTSETIVKYALHMYKHNSNWSSRGPLLYYTELITECSILMATLAHYGHIFFLHGISLTLNAILFLHMRIVFSNLRRKLSAYSNYLKLSRAMRNKYPSVTPEQLAELDDDCAICREPMESAKKLPCSHVFHENCLRLWLEHHHSCPTCRYQLIGSNNQVVTEENVVEVAPQRFEWFRRWFRRRRIVVTPEMVNAVREIAPHVPEAWIAQDLARTGSANATVERIFERFPVPAEPNAEQEAARNIPVPGAGEAPQIIADNEIEETIETVTQDVQKLEKEIPVGFGRNSSEREKLLRDRKELMKQKGRLAFLKRQGERSRSMPNTISDPEPRPSQDERKQEIPELLEGDTMIEKFEEEETGETVEMGEMPSFSLQDSLEIRRRRALLAAERRRLTSSAPNQTETL